MSTQAPMCRHCEEHADLAALSDVELDAPCPHLARLGTAVQGAVVLEELVSVDAISAVYRASDATGVALLAIVLDPGLGPVDLAGVAAFQRFAQEVIGLRHERVAVTRAFGAEDDGSVAAVVERPAGRPLRDLLGRGPQPVALVSELAVQIFDGLAEAHAHGIFHADLSPDRIWVDLEGPAPRVTLVGFGLTPVGAGAHGPAQPAHTIAIGAPRYMAPEQARGRSVVGHADLYGAAVVLYELLAGRAPFEERTAADYIVAHLSATPAPPRGDEPAVAGVLVDCVMKCLAKKAWDRPNGAAVASEWVALHAVGKPERGGACATVEAVALPMSRRAKDPLATIQPRRGSRPTRFGIRVAVATNA